MKISDLTELDIILICLDTTASFRVFDSKTTLSGDRCKILLDYIRELEKLKKEVK